MAWPHKAHERRLSFDVVCQPSLLENGERGEDARDVGSDESRLLAIKRHQQYANEGGLDLWHCSKTPSLIKRLSKQRFSPKHDMKEDLV